MFSTLIGDERHLATKLSTIYLLMESRAFPPLRSISIFQSEKDMVGWCYVKCFGLS